MKNNMHEIVVKASVSLRTESQSVFGQSLTRTSSRSSNPNTFLGDRLNSTWIKLRHKSMSSMKTFYKLVTFSKCNASIETFTIILLLSTMTSSNTFLLMKGINLSSKLSLPIYLMFFEGLM